MELYNGSTLLGSYSQEIARTSSADLRGNPTMYTVEMRVRGNRVRVYSGSSYTLRFTATASGFSGGYAGYRSDSTTVCELLRLGDAWTYEPYERFDVQMPDGTQKSYGRISRTNCTWDEEFQVFTLTSDVEETSTRSEDISLDYDFFHSDLLEISCGGNYTAKVIPKDINIWISRLFFGRCGRVFHPLLPGRGFPHLLGEPGGVPLEAPGDVYVVFGAGGYAAVGMAAEANRITYGNWRLPCGAAAFFIHKTISRNGGINMKELWNTAQVIFAAIGGWLGYFLGGCDGLLIALVVFVAVDYVTGVMCAISDKKLSSEVGFKGICRKVLIFLLVGIANILDMQVIGTGSVLRTAVIFFYLSNEGVSLLENAAHLGLPVPEKMKDILAQLHDRAEKEEN